MALLEILRKSGIPYIPFGDIIIKPLPDSFVVVDRRIPSPFEIVETPCPTTGIPYSSFARVGQMMIDRVNYWRASPVLPKPP